MSVELALRIPPAQGQPTLSGFPGACELHADDFEPMGSVS